MLPEPKVALIDADFLVWRIGFASEEDDVAYAKSRVTEYLTDLVYFSLKAEDYKAYISGSNNFRYDIAKTVPYKHNRKDAKKPKHYEALREHLQRLGAKVVDGQEADDAVAIDASRGNYWITHVDKDINQVPGWHYNPVKDEKYYVTEEGGLKSFYTQLLTGDRTDGIPGLAKVGPVKAAKILKDAVTEEELCKAAWEAYQDRGHGLEYFKEQGQLLWLRREEGQMWEPLIG
jgi:DNA polymerase-1